MLTGTRADTPSMPITLDLVLAPPCGTISEGSQRRPLLQGDSGVICVKDAVSARQVVVSRYITRWEFCVGVITLIVLFKFGKGIWGNIDPLIREKFKRKSEMARDGKVSCSVNPKGDQ